MRAINTPKAVNTRKEGERAGELKGGREEEEIREEVEKERGEYCTQYCQSYGKDKFGPPAKIAQCP